MVSYDISTGGPPAYIGMAVDIVDRDGNVVGTSVKSKDNITIPNANFWWPYTLNKLNPGYLYTLKVIHHNLFIRPLNGHFSI